VQRLRRGELATGEMLQWTGRRAEGGGQRNLVSRGPPLGVGPGQR
jgi:hypothetical protein